MMSNDYVRTYGHENENGEWVRPIPKPDDEYTYQWNHEWTGDEDKPILKITKSSLGSFKWCNKQYEFSYIDRRPQDQTEPMLKGTIIHDAYEAFYKSADVNKMENMSYLEINNYMTGLFPISDYTEMTDTIAAFEAQRFVDARAEDKIKEWMPEGNEIMLDAEITIGANDNPKYPLTRDYRVHLQGIIDRVYSEDGRSIPFELKTGLWKDSKKTDMRREMSYYKMLMENSPDWEGTITHWGWYYPASNYVYVEEVNKRSETAMKKALATIIYSYEQDYFKPTYFHKKCVHCSYVGICPAAIDAELNTGSGWL